RSAGHGDGPGVAQKRVIRVHTFAQTALDVVHRVDQARIHLDLTATDHADRTWLADTALVVAVDVRAHRELGLVLLGIQELEDLLGIGNRILAALDGAGNRTGLNAPTIDADEHLRRCA